MSVAIPLLVPETATGGGTGEAGTPAGAAAPGWCTQRIAGAAVGGVGVAGVAVGAIFGALALSEDTQSFCSPTDTSTCTPAGASARSDAHTFAHVSTAGFVAGGVLLAGGVVLLATAPRAKAATAVGMVRVGPVWGPGVRGVALGGAW